MSSSSTSNSFRRPDAGSRTVEGNVSGGRAAALERKRQEEEEAFELAKRQRLQSTASTTASLSKFRTATKVSAAEQAFSNQTVGLVTAEEFMAAASVQQKSANALKLIAGTTDNDAVAAEMKQELQESEKEREKREKAERKARKRKLKEKKKQMATLSFGAEAEEDEENTEETTTISAGASKKSKTFVSKKDPTIDTSFLPDKQRDEHEQEQRKLLEREWVQRQEEIKKEKLEITYSYWDGSGHRRSIVCQKGDSIGNFLKIALMQQLSKEFRNLQGVSQDDLMYIKEDLIIPNDLTFYDLIATKARGKSGPLFLFDVRDDVRVGPLDVRVEKEESHPGKVVERKWYERNKHIFPASRWEVYDPTKDSYGTYTIGGDV